MPLQGMRLSGIHKSRLNRRSLVRARVEIFRSTPPLCQGLWWHPGSRTLLMVFKKDVSN